MVQDYLVLFAVVLILLIIFCLCISVGKDARHSGRSSRYIRGGDYQFRRSSLVGDYQSRRSSLGSDYPSRRSSLGSDYLFRRSGLGSDYQFSSGNQITSFVRDVIIPYFQDQSTKSQFAVIILLSKRETENKSLIGFNPLDLNGRPVVNNAHSYMPARSKFCNYIVARPHNGQDAEIIIFKEFDNLWKEYIHKNGEEPHSIILYSLLMPCTNCTDKIINTLARRRAKVTVVYTSKNSESELTREYNQRRLRQEFSIVRIRSTWIGVSNCRYYTYKPCCAIRGGRTGLTFAR